MVSRRVPAVFPPCWAVAVPGVPSWPAVLTPFYQNPGSWRKRLSKSSVCICVGPARSAPRICAHLRRSAVPLLLFRCCSSGPTKTTVTSRSTAGNQQSNSNNTAVARRPTAGYGVKPVRAPANSPRREHGVNTDLHGRATTAGSAFNSKQEPLLIERLTER